MIDRRRLLAAGPVLLAAGAAAGRAGAQVPPISSDDRALGRADAAVQVIEYASLSCSHCAHWHAEVWPEFRRRYVDSGRVRFALREVLTEPPQVAAGGFLLARCAPPARYYDALAVLFDAQAQLITSPSPVDTFASLGPQFGVSEPQVRACFRDEAAFNALTARLERTRAAGVSSTPTFVVNGRVLAGEQSVEQLAAVIDPLLARPARRGTAARRGAAR